MSDVIGSSRLCSRAATSSLPLQKKPKLLPAFLFWPCTTVEPIIDRRERDPNEFCQSVPRQTRFKLIFLQPFQKASAFSDPNRVFWPPNSHLHKHRRRLGAPSIRRASSRRNVSFHRPGNCCRSHQRGLAPRPDFSSSLRAGMSPENTL